MEEWVKRSYGKGFGVGEGTDYSVSNHDCPSSTLCKFGNWRGEGMETKPKKVLYRYAVL